MTNHNGVQIEVPLLPPEGYAPGEPIHRVAFPGPLRTHDRWPYPDAFRNALGGKAPACVGT